MKLIVRLAVVALPALAFGGSPAVAHDHCGAHHSCAECAPAEGHHHGCLACGSSSATAPDAIPGGQPFGGAYDPDTVATLRGTVTGVTVVPGQGGRAGGTHVTLERDGAVTEARLGPTWFLEREGIELSKGDSLEVTGSVVDSAGVSVLIAREIRKGTKVLRLRDERGFPEWAGRTAPQ